jgi:ABC-2 type transport system permease protein
MIALYVFWIRQVKKFFRVPARIFGSLGQPLLYLVALGLGLGSAVGDVGDTSYLSYLVPGIMGLTVLFASMFSGIELIGDRRFGFLRETLVAPVRRVWVYLGMAAGGATIAVFQGLLVFFLGMLFGFTPASWLGVLAAIPVMFIIAMLFTMVGLMLATKIRDFQSFPIIINFVIFPLFFLSGAIFPLEGIPKGLEIVTQLNPLTYGIDVLRELIVSAGFYPVWMGLAVLVGLVVICGVWGTQLFKKMTI